MSGVTANSFFKDGQKYSGTYHFGESDQMCSLVRALSVLISSNLNMQ